MAASRSCCGLLALALALAGLAIGGSAVAAEIAIAQLKKDLVGGDAGQ